MSPCLRESEIARFVSGDLPEHERERIAHHIEECPTCRRRVEWAKQADLLAETSDTSAGTTSRSDSSHASGDFAALPAIEGYEILARIHGGSQGTVYKAVQKSTRRTVAVKILLHEAAGHTATERQKFRFEREINLAASLHHPNIATIYDSGLTSGRYFFAMEYIHGGSLDEYLKTTPLTIAQRLRLFVAICSAVSYAHQKGVIHRDLKPGNILVDAAGDPHIVDFGLAKPAGVLAMHGDSPFTLTSQFMGTIAYASPEQTKGDPALIDTRSDVYSLGVILFEMLTTPGMYPYPMSPVLVKMFHTICHTPPREPSSLNKEVDSDLDTIVLRALAKEPERRYQTVADLQDDVERRLAGEPISARRDSLIYLLRVRGRRWVTRHSITAVLGVVGLAALSMYLAWAPVHRLWSWPFDRYEHLLLAHFSPEATGVPYRQIVVVAITDETGSRIEELAEREGLQGVSGAPQNWRSVRALHGRLMQRLAQFSIGALAWDIAFPHPKDPPEIEHVAPFNRIFVDGVEALKRAGIRPVVAVRGWDGAKSSTAGISPDILAADVRRGGGIYRHPAHAPWRVALVVKRGPGLELPGLSLVAAYAALRPNEEIKIELAEFFESLRLRFPRPLPTPDEYEDVRISYVAAYRPTARDQSDIELQMDDLVAWMVVSLPTDDEIKRMTIPYHEVFTTDERKELELKSLFAGKLVVVADLRTAASDEAQLAPDGRRIPPPYAHVAAMDSLLRRAVTMRFPNDIEYFVILSIGAIIGVGVVRLVPGSRLLRCAALLTGAAIMLLASVIGYHQTGFLCNPVFPASAMFLAFAIAAGLRWSSQVRPSSL